MERFRQEVGEHVVGLTISKHNVVSIEPVRNEEISNIDMARSLAGRGAPVSFETDGALVVLFQVTVSVWKTLSLQEILNPNGTGEILADPNQLSLGGTFRDHLLFGGFTSDPTTSKRDDPARMTFHVVMDGIGGVNKRVHGLNIVGTQDQR